MHVRLQVLHARLQVLHVRLQVLHVRLQEICVKARSTKVLTKQEYKGRIKNVVFLIKFKKSSFDKQ